MGPNRRNDERRGSVFMFVLAFANFGIICADNLTVDIAYFLLDYTQSNLHPGTEDHRLRDLVCVRGFFWFLL